MNDEMARLAMDCGLTAVRLIGYGVQFFVYAAEHPRHGPVAVRLPRFRMIDTVNEQALDSALLIEQEHQVTSLLHAHGLPTSQPLEKRYTASGSPVLISAFIAADAIPPDWHQVGMLFARLHDLPAPDGLPTHPAGLPIADLLAERLAARMASLHDIRPELPGGHWQA